MASAITELGSSTDETRVAERKAAMGTLIRLAQTGSTVVWNENFRAVLRLLLEQLQSEDGSLRALALTVITEMMRRYPLVQHFLMFSELIILRVLKAHADKTKEVIRAAQVRKSRNCYFFSSHCSPFRYVLGSWLKYCLLKL